MGKQVANNEISECHDKSYLESAEEACPGCCKPGRRGRERVFAGGSDASQTQGERVTFCSYMAAIIVFSKCMY